MCINRYMRACLPVVFVKAGLWLDFLCKRELKKLANTPSPGDDALVDFTGSIYITN